MATFKEDIKMRKKRISLVLVIAMLLSLIPFSAATAEGEPAYTFNTSEGNVTIDDGTDPGTYKVLYGNPQVEADNISQSQIITLVGATATSNYIMVKATSGTVKLRFAGFEISGTMNIVSSLTRNVEILLADDTESIVRNGLYNNSPANGGGTLLISCEHAQEAGHICDEHCGSLKVYGNRGQNSAGISGHNTTINGGNIYADGGNSSPGIGVYGFYGTVKNLRFNGGNITAIGTGGYGAAGIGGGDCTNVDGVYIDGGRITAKGGGSGPGIGGGQMFKGDGGQAHNVIINSGTVCASGKNIAIGGPGACSNIQINGGSVDAVPISIQPVNTAGTPVYRTVITLEGISAVTRVTDITITGADYYGKKDIFTDAAGKIYLYLPEGAYVTKVKTAANTYTGYIGTTSDGKASAVFKGAPILALVSVKRTSDTHADIKFSSSKDARGYSALREAGAEAPVFDDTSFEANLTLVASPGLTINLDNLTPGAKDYYIVAKDSAGNVSEPLKIEIPAYVPPQPGIISFDVDTYQPDEGFDGRMIRVSRTGGSDGVVSVDYHMEDGTAKEGTHYTACTGTLEWPDGDSNDRKIWFIAIDDNVYSGFRDLVCVLSNPTGGAELGERSRVLIQIRDNDNPPVPAGLRAVAGKGQVTLSWDPVNDACYKLYYSNEAGNFTNFKWIESGTVNHTFTGLTNGTTYYYSIEAIHGQHFSERSDSVSATPQAPALPVVYEAPKYNVRESEQDEQSGGAAEFSKKRAEAGETVTFTSNPDIGYESGMPAVYDRNGNPVPVTDNGDGSFSFKMPAGGADVETTFNRIDYFDDVSEDDWFDEASWYCAAHGLMKGTGERQFDGDRGTTRAMLVTVLYNLTNNPDDFESIFDDVEKGKWYSNPIAWAARNKIVEGYGDGKFGPDDDLTREQIASILYSYSMFMKYDLGNQDSLEAFLDKESISGWALEAMKWAFGNGILEAVEKDLISPKTGATRAELAEMMQRYVTRFVK